MKNNSVHLCDSCLNCYPECSNNDHEVEFGDGRGNDNICCCNKYDPLLERDYDRDGYKKNGKIMDEYDELVCNECKECYFYQNQNRYCPGEEEPCENRKVN